MIIIQWAMRVLCLQSAEEKRAKRIELNNDKEQIARELHEVSARVRALEWQADVKSRKESR